MAVPPPEGQEEILFLVDSSFSRLGIPWLGAASLQSLHLSSHSVLSVLLKGYLLLDLEPTWIF